jgi:hypothetical protein
MLTGLLRGRFYLIEIFFSPPVANVYFSPHFSGKNSIGVSEGQRVRGSKGQKSRSVNYTREK